MKNFLSGLLFFSILLCGLVVFGQVAADPDTRNSGKFRFTFSKDCSTFNQAIEEGETYYYTFSTSKAKNSNLIEIRKYDRFGKVVASVDKAVDKSHKKHTGYFNTSLGVITIFPGVGVSYDPKGQGGILLDTKLNDIDITKEEGNPVPPVIDDMGHMDLMRKELISTWCRAEDAFAISNDNAQLNEKIMGTYNSLKLRRFVSNMGNIVSALESSYKAIWLFEFGSVFEINEKIKASIYAKIIGVTDTDIISYTKAWNEEDFNQHYFCFNDIVSGKLDYKVRLDERYSMQKYYFDGESLFIAGSYADNVKGGSVLTSESKGVYFGTIDDVGNLKVNSIDFTDDFKDSDLATRFKKSELKYGRFIVDEVVKLKSGNYLVIGEYQAVFSKKLMADWWFTNEYGYYIVDKDLKVISKSFSKVHDDFAEANTSGDQKYVDYFFDEEKEELLVLYGYGGYSYAGVMNATSLFTMNIDKGTVTQLPARTYNDDCLRLNENYHFIDSNSMLVFRCNDINNIEIKKLD